jgi:hypothetical protein
LIVWVLATGVAAEPYLFAAALAVLVAFVELHKRLHSAWSGFGYRLTYRRGAWRWLLLRLTVEALVGLASVWLLLNVAGVSESTPWYLLGLGAGLGGPTIARSYLLYTGTAEGSAAAASAATTTGGGGVSTPSTAGISTEPESARTGVGLARLYDPFCKLCETKLNENIATRIAVWRSGTVVPTLLVTSSPGAFGDLLSALCEERVKSGASLQTMLAAQKTISETVAGTSSNEEKVKALGGVAFWLDAYELIQAATKTSP